MSGLEPVEYAHHGTVLTGWLARPRHSAKAAILIWPTIANVTPAVERRATMLADLGYLALIGDFYGERVVDMAAAMQLGQAMRADAENYRARLVAGLEALLALPEAASLPIAAIGYCQGGQAALELARAGADLAAVVSFHGLLETLRPARPGVVKSRILVCHGDADPMAPRAAVLKLWEELDAAGANWQFHSYSGVKHGFTDPGSDARGLPAIGYNASADRQSWAAMLSLFDEVFGPD